MSKAAIKAFGFVTLLFVVLVFLNGKFHFLLEARDGLFLSLVLFFLTVLGVGLICLQKWAALNFSLLLLALPARLFLELVVQVPAESMDRVALLLSTLAVAIVVSIPVTIVVRSWPVLSLMGKHASRSIQ